MEIKIPIELPDNWMDELIAKLKKDGTLVPVIHAHWIRCKVGYGMDGLSCSNCGEARIMYSKTKFCPECGAKMDEEDKHES